ncbi:MAG: DUF308 domain-containing protein [Marmoricola sp.]
MSWLEMSWKLLVARGVLAIVFGLVAMIWPVETLVTLVVLWGIWALVDGISSIAGAFRAEGGLATTVLALTGVIALVAAFFAIFRPGMTGTALTWVLGIWLIVRGAIDAIAAIAGYLPGSKLLSLLAAGLSIVAGIIFVANPGGAAVALAFWLGLIALLWGIVFLVVGLITRSKLGDARPSAPATA